MFLRNASNYSVAGGRALYIPWKGSLTQSSFFRAQNDKWRKEENENIVFNKISICYALFLLFSMMKIKNKPIAKTAVQTIDFEDL